MTKTKEQILEEFRERIMSADNKDVMMAIFEEIKIEFEKHGIEDEEA